MIVAVLVVQWLVPAMLVGAVVLVILRRWRHGRTAAWTALAVQLVLGGLCALRLVGSFGGESVDPSQRARVLAQGISEAMNCVAFTVLVLLIALPTIWVATARIGVATPPPPP